ncbi:LPXTG cell wall anchor domain-containing protein [Enterococcus casseliflavus]|uniref:LPXTG cell wall anchor domain-containing protein n=1 Tax=Enterococcus casseliflavus TaxID=37734 RepID=UPI001BCE3680|nr:LPXTG cell wall anchor domain-containing protein [Enterococcus casseliflavus]
MKKEIETSLMTTAILGTFTVKTCFAQEKSASYLTDPITHHVLLKDGEYWYDEGKSVPKEYADQLIANEQLSKPTQEPDPHPTMQVPSQKQPVCQPQQIPAPKKQNEQTIPTSKEPFGVPEMKPEESKQPASTIEPIKTPQAVPLAVPKPSGKVAQEVIPTSAPHAVPGATPTVINQKQESLVPTKTPIAVPEKIPAPLVTFDYLVPNKVPYAVPGATPTAINQKQEFLVPTKIPMAVPEKIPAPLVTFDSLVPNKVPYAVPSATPTVIDLKQEFLVPTNAPIAVPEKSPTPLVTFDSLVPNKIPYAVPGATPTAINQNQEFLVPTKIPMAIPSKIPTPLNQTEFPQPGIPVNGEPKALTIVHPKEKEQIAALPSSKAMKTKNLDNGIHRQQKSNTPSRVKSIRKKLVQQKPKEPSKKNFDNNEERENTRLNHKQQINSYTTADNSYLPKTGENRLLSFLMQAVGIMVIGIAGLLFFRKKGRHEK